MKPRLSPKAALAALLAVLLAGCASMPPPDIHRDGAYRQRQADAARAGGTADANGPSREDDEGPRARIRRGSGQLINQVAAAVPPRHVGGTTGQAEFNFEGESLHAVVKAILGDMLGQNYIIAPGVQGTVTYVTSKPVSPAEALSVLEMILAWNNARLVYADGRYNIVPADSAMATGTIPARTGGTAGTRGFETRVVQLKYISATEMEKILKPFARPNAVVHVDNSRNVITVAGSRAELDNYLRTIEIFDVDWLSGMSVGVFPLQAGKATRVVTDLEKVFGEQGKSPVAGMFRFMPLEGANAVMVITPQPEYLDQIEDWLERIDSAGQDVRLYSYELKYIKARDLADRLAEVFGGSRAGGDDAGGGTPLMPGLTAGMLGDGSLGRSGEDGAGASGRLDGNGGFGGLGGLSGADTGSDRRGGGNVVLEVDGARVGVSAIEETNSLLVRTSPSAWKSIREVIERLDVMPLQVHIEAQIAQVELRGELEYGVQWFVEHGGSGVNGLPDLSGDGLPPKWSTFGGSVTGTGLAWTLVKNDAAAIIRALDSVTDVRLLQTPSVFVRNNVEATLLVGDKIPISTVSVNPILGSDNSLTSVQYIETGTILKVRPRVTRDGTVFLEIVQEISAPTGTTDNNGNPRISTRSLKTEAVARDGDTIMLAGLINDGVDRGSGGIPGLNRIPVLGSLFGTQRSHTTRNETIILITARIVNSTQEAADLTDEYGRRFRALEPLYPPRRN